MRLISWNVNGLRAAFQKNFVEQISKINPDLVFLQESKTELNQLSTDQQNLLDYNLELVSAQKKGYSGVACYSKKHLDYKVIAKGLGCQEFDSEGRYLVSQAGNLKIYNIYFPSGSSGDLRQDFKYKFLDHFYEYLCNLDNLDNLIICGDFNICHKDIDIHHPKTAAKLELSGFLPAERTWMDKFCELGFTDSFRKVNGNNISAYSWWSYRANARNKNLGWRIDYFFISNNLVPYLKDALILPEISGSDHCPVLLELDMP